MANDANAEESKSSLGEQEQTDHIPNPQDESFEEDSVPSIKNFDRSYSEKIESDFWQGRVEKDQNISAQLNGT